jgi:zinc protease
MRSVRIRQVIPALLFVSLFALAHAAAQTGPPVPLPEGIARVTAVEGITEYRLANGLRVLLFPDTSKSTITVNITYLVGSVHESYGETGMAHLLEHLLFKGSSRHPDIPKELRDRGTRPNGTTSYERTNYFETFDASADNLEWALDLESDRMVNAFVRQEDLDSEMTVVRNEFEASENNPLGVLYRRVLAAAYLWHNYGKPVIGSRSDIENVPIDRLQAFYRRYYQPDNAILIVAGKIDEAETLRLVQKYFAPIPRPERVLQRLYTTEPTQDGERQVVLRRVGDVQNVIAAYHAPPGSHEDFAALQIVSQILTSPPSGRLYKALVETGKASNVGSSLLQLRDPGMTMYLAEVRTEASLDDAQQTLLATIDDIASTPFTEEEVERARNRLLSAIELQLNNTEQVALQLSNWEAMGDWRLLFLNRDRLRRVSVADAQRVALHYARSSNRTVGLFVPEDSPDRAEIPEAPDLAALFAGYAGDAARAEGEAFDPSPVLIEARTRRLTLPGGLKLVVLPKQTRGNAVVAQLRLDFGDEGSLRGRSAAGTLTASMLMRGTTSRTRQQIQDELDRLQAQMGIFGGSTSVTANIQTTRDNLPAVLTLASDVLRNPSFPAGELDTLRQQMLSRLESQRSEPQAVVPRAFQRHTAPYPEDDVRYVPTIDEQIEWIQRVTLEELRAFHADFYGASNAHLSIVGAFDPEAVQQVAAAGLGAWTSPRPYAEVTSPFRRIEPVNEVFETPDKANAVFLAGMRINLGDAHPDYPALLFANYLLGQGINSRLFARIRGREGLSYGVGSSLSVSPADDNALFLANAISAPENADRVEASFRDELSIILRDGFSEEEIAIGKVSWAQSQQVNRSQDQALASRLLVLNRYGRTLVWDADLEARVQALTTQDIVGAMRRHLDLSALTIMKGGDFSKAGGAPRP